MIVFTRWEINVSKVKGENVRSAKFAIVATLNSTVSYHLYVMPVANVLWLKPNTLWSDVVMALDRPYRKIDYSCSGTVLNVWLEFF